MSENGYCPHFEKEYPPDSPSCMSAKLYAHTGLNIPDKLDTCQECPLYRAPKKEATK